MRLCVAPPPGQYRFFTDEKGAGHAIAARAQWHVKLACGPKPRTHGGPGEPGS
jgi:hypothetical protein